jgi:cupin fold WbuC family metalloprotein
MDMGKRNINPEVIVTECGVVKVRGGDISEMKAKAAYNERKRIRLCAHESIEDPLHEMLIIHARDTYVPPHKHVNKSESIYIIEGEVDLVLLTPEGEIDELVPMGDYLSGHYMYCRLPESTFHTLRIRSDVLVFHETTNGPFRREGTVFASWSPDETSPDVDSYTADLEKRIAQHKL